MTEIDIHNAATETSVSVVITVETDAGLGLPESVVAAVDLSSRRDEGGERFVDEIKEKVCRICHLSSEQCEGSDLIQLGCGCKGELGAAHRHCAEAWFMVKGDRYSLALIIYSCVRFYLFLGFHFTGILNMPGN